MRGCGARRRSRRGGRRGCGRRLRVGGSLRKSRRGPQGTLKERHRNVHEGRRLNMRACEGEGAEGHTSEVHGGVVRVRVGDDLLHLLMKGTRNEKFLDEWGGSSEEEEWEVLGRDGEGGHCRKARTGRHVCTFATPEEPSGGDPMRMVCGGEEEADSRARQIRGKHGEESLDGKWPTFSFALASLSASSRSLATETEVPSGPTFPSSCFRTLASSSSTSAPLRTVCSTSL